MRAISEGLRQEAGDKIRVTIISPGAVESELAETISNPDVKKRVQDYRKMAIPAEAIASAMAYAMGSRAMSTSTRFCHAQHHKQPGKTSVLRRTAAIRVFRS